MIGTEKGLSIYDQGNVRFYDEEQGFESRISQTAKVIGDELWLGTSVGYYWVNLPELLKQKDFPLDLVITDLEINHQPEPQDPFPGFPFKSGSLSCPTPKTRFTSLSSLGDINFRLCFCRPYCCSALANG